MLKIKTSGQKKKKKEVKHSSHTNLIIFTWYWYIWWKLKQPKHCNVTAATVTTEFKTGCYCFYGKNRNILQKCGWTESFIAQLRVKEKENLEPPWRAFLFFLPFLFTLFPLFVTLKKNRGHTKLFLLHWGISLSPRTLFVLRAQGRISTMDRDDDEEDERWWWWNLRVSALSEEEKLLLLLALRLDSEVHNSVWTHIRPTLMSHFREWMSETGRPTDTELWKREP